MTADASDQLFYRLSPGVRGEFGRRSILDTRSDPPIVHWLHFEFMGWDGDDLVESFPCFLVSERLASALVEAELTGFELSDVEITLNEQFEEFFPDRSVPPRLAVAQAHRRATHFRLLG